MARNSVNKNGEFILKAYADSVSAYTKAGDENQCQMSFKRFLEAKKQLDFIPKAFFYFNQMIHVLEEHGLMLARDVYIEMQRSKQIKYYFYYRYARVCESWINLFEELRTPINILNKCLNKIKGVCPSIVKFFFLLLFRISVLPLIIILSFVYVFTLLLGNIFWGITSRYGESIFRWGLSCFCVIVVFSILYYPQISNKKCKDYYVHNAHKCVYDNSEKLLRLDTSCWTSVHFSVTVFTTLGFGDIFPCQSVSKLIVIIEVLLGYAFLGVLITLIARKIRR